MLLRFQGVSRKEQNLFHLLTRRLISSHHKTTAVTSFGDGAQGALGLPLLSSALRAMPTSPLAFLLFPLISPPSPLAIITLSRLLHKAIFGPGAATMKPSSVETNWTRGTWNEPKRVGGLDDVRVSAAFASGVVSAAIGDDGSFWIWGKSKRGQLGLGDGVTEAVVPCRVKALAGENITKASFGWGHALALTKDGRLFGWGYSADGRIGRLGGSAKASPLDSSFDLGENHQVPQSKLEAAERLVLEGIDQEKDMPIIWAPSLVEELHGVEVVDIACGLDHSLVLCRDGTLLSSGSNSYGQLGRVNDRQGLFPVDLSFCPLSVESGLGHSLAICRVALDGDARNIVSWGWNQTSQLGRSGPENTPLEVEGLAGETPISVAGGRVHSIALTSKGEVWAWGCGKNGRLGLGSSTDEAEPMPLDSLNGYEVLQVVSGFDHNLLLIAE